MHSRGIRATIDAQDTKEAEGSMTETESRKKQRKTMGRGTRTLIALLRPFYRHKLIGADELRLDADTPCIFVCNHGEIYGPVVTTLYMPFAYRPWVTHEATERSAMVDLICNGALKYKPIVNPRFDRFLISHIAAPMTEGIMKSIGAIPIYRNDPRKLVVTFRETVTAMREGDNILIFPEDAATEPDGRYLREGVSEFFTGFTMIAQLYEHQTGRCPLFVPIYANRKKHTVTFCKPIRYRPEDASPEGKERLCRELRAEMLEAAGRG